MQRIGLTGGIGSGKSTIAHLLRVLGYPVYESDREAARITDSDTSVREKLTNVFGPDIYTTQGLHKPLFASLIFKDPSLLKQANAIIHPAVMDDFMYWSSQQHTPLIFMESAIIFEAGLNNHFDAVITVYADPETRIQRVIARDHTAREKALERIGNQWPDEEKVKMADYIISNNEHDMILAQLLKIISILSIKD